jgi:glycosyltransferase involved in cell wall biosynthesis
MRPAPIVACFPFLGEEIGGSHISAIKLIEGFDPERVRPLIVLHNPNGPVADYLEERGIQFHAAPAATRFWPDRNQGSFIRRAPRFVAHSVRSVRVLTRFLSALGVDVVHTNDGRTHVGWALPAYLAGARHVWHHRGDPDARGSNLIAPIFASQVVTVSSFARPRRPLFGLGHKLSVVPSPFDACPAGDRAAARSMLIDNLGCPGNTRFLGYFGLLIDRKRPLLFVEAVATFVRQYPDIPVMGLMFGAPGQHSPHLDLDVMRRAAELGIADRIQLMGFRAPVEPWMLATDILLVPAVREPFGRTLIEAMFLETPVIATDHGGNPEAIEHGVTGILVQPERPDAFVAPIHRLLTDAEFRTWITTNARRRALATYGVEVHVKRITEIYEKIVGHRRRTHEDVATTFQRAMQ